MNSSLEDKHTTLFNLREIFSLLEQKESIKLKMDNEKARLEKIDQLIQRRQKDKEELELDLANKKKQLREIEADYEKLNHQLEQSKANKNSITNQKEQVAFEKTILSQSEKLNKMEESLYSHMEKVEEIEDELKEIEGFKINIQQSKSQIQSEVQAEVQKLKNEINNKQERYNFVFNQLPDLFQQKINKTLSKKLRYPLISQITSQNKCFVCQFQLNSQMTTQIDQLNSLNNCPSCKRLLLPIE